MSQNNAGQEQGQGRVRQAQEHEHHDRDQLGHETHKAGQVNPKERHAPAPPAAGEKTGITIYIDHTPYHAANANFSGAELRNLPHPPIGPEKDIFRVVAGKGDDIKLKDTDAIAVNMREANQGRHFFSDTIVPAKDAVARRAYCIYLEDGGKPGRDAENWAKAEAELDTRSKA